VIARFHLGRSSALLAGFVTFVLASPAAATPFYSIDWQSASAGVTSEGDIVIPTGSGMFPSPTVAIPFGGGGLGAQATSVGFREVDAVSFGIDPRLQNTPLHTQRWLFSVDEHATGLPAVPAPSVTTEAAPAITEAAADIFQTDTPPGPIGSTAAGVNLGRFDGNGGLTTFASQGLNLLEPNPADAVQPDAGDNLDAFDLEGPAAFAVYFSLDNNLISDPLEGGVTGTGTAAANGFSGADVLVSPAAGGPPALFASAAALGLATPGQVNDLDALVLWENGNGVFDVPTQPYSWLGGSPTDMLFFSVRRESSLTGTFDSLHGLRIEPGDILMPIAGATPGIFVTAEQLGLETRRNNAAIPFGDELDALDVQQFLDPPPSDGVIPEPSTLPLMLAGGLLVGLRRRRSVRLACAMLLVMPAAVIGTGPTAWAVPINGMFVDAPGVCDDPGNQHLSHELGDLTVFPIDEAIDVTVTLTPQLVCVPDDGIANDWNVRITNQSNITYENLFFVADAFIPVGNADGRAVDLSLASPPGADAFRIDGTVTVTGMNDNLLSETGTLNERFEPGETWEFLVSNFGASDPPAFASVGEFAGSSIGDLVSNASILATPVSPGGAGVIPEPSTAVFVLAAGLALIPRYRRNRG